MANPELPPQVEYTPEQKAQLEALWNEGAELEARFDIHPIVRAVIHTVIEGDGRRWPSVLAPEKEALIWEMLEETKRERTINKAVFDLTRLSVMLDHDMKVGRFAYELLRICNDAVVRFDLLASMDLARIDDTDDHSEVTGAAGRSQPAKVGDKPPEGSMKIDRIAPKRRI